MMAGFHAAQAAHTDLTARSRADHMAHIERVRAVRTFTDLMVRNELAEASRTAPTTGTLPSTLQTLNERIAVTDRRAETARAAANATHTAADHALAAEIRSDLLSTTTPSGSSHHISNILNHNSLIEFNSTQVRYPTCRICLLTLLQPRVQVIKFQF